MHVDDGAPAAPPGPPPVVPASPPPAAPPGPPPVAPAAPPPAAPAASPPSGVGGDPQTSVAGCATHRWSAGRHISPLGQGVSSGHGPQASCGRKQDGAAPADKQARTMATYFMEGSFPR